VNDEILAKLDKGHTARQAADAVALLREHGIEPRPSLMPFTPWTTLDDVRELIRFLDRHDLAANVDPVQLSIRLLLPEGSLLLEREDIQPHLRGYDAAALSHRWRAADPAVDDLQARLAALVEGAATSGEAPLETFARVREAAGAGDPGQLGAGSVEGRPRLTEPWFC
jgi:hypothetical protein